MKKTLSKKEAKKKIEEFFLEVKNKTPKEIKKMKKLAMNYNIPLKEKRKLFCKNCYSIYKNSKIRIKNKLKIVKCSNCNHVSRIKI
jgi:predicted Zn finger-like uncharacterized protein